MQIQIPDEQYDKLTLRATAAGYEDVAALIAAMAEESTVDPRGTLSQSELRESVAKLKQADASIDAGKGIEAEEALRRIALKHGLQIDA